MLAVLLVTLTQTRSPGRKPVPDTTNIGFCDTTRTAGRFTTPNAGVTATAAASTMLTKTPRMGP